MSCEGACAMSTLCSIHLSVEIFEVLEDIQSIFQSKLLYREKGIMEVMSKIY